MKRFLQCSALALAAVAGTGCLAPEPAACSDMSGCDSSLRLGAVVYSTSPEGRLEATADQVWPLRPESSPLTASELAAACIKLAACLPNPDAPQPEQARASYLSMCLSVNPYEERAIPFGSDYFFATVATDFLPDGRQAAERWTYFARAVLASDGGCDELRTILTTRPDEVTCTEAGCWWYSTDLPIPAVSCDGNVAVLATAGQTFRRDCSGAYLACDADSPTGCTDRAPTACEVGALEVCDGSVRLGCDAYGRVTYHDCGWIEGGRCAEREGGADCALTAPSCSAEEAQCDGAQLRVCAAGKSIVVDCNALGFGGCVESGDLASCGN